MCVPDLSKWTLILTFACFIFYKSGSFLFHKVELISKDVTFGSLGCVSLELVFLRNSNMWYFTSQQCAGYWLSLMFPAGLVDGHPCLPCTRCLG